MISTSVTTVLTRCKHAQVSALEEFSRKLQLAAINDPAEKEAQLQRKTLVEETKKQTVILDGIRSKPSGGATFS